MFGDNIGYFSPETESNTCQSGNQYALYSKSKGNPSVDNKLKQTISEKGTVTVYLLWQNPPCCS